MISKTEKGEQNEKDFIGSSTEQKDTARLIARWLEDFGIDPVPWYDPGVFVPGHYTLDDLVHQTKEVDAAIFVFAADDKLWYRNDVVSTVRDNVLFEFGLFCGELSYNNVIFIVKDKPALASDLKGITYIDITKRNGANERLEIWLKSIGFINANRIEAIMPNEHGMDIFDQNGYASQIYTITGKEEWTEIQVDYSVFNDCNESAFAGAFLKFDPTVNIAHAKELRFKMCFDDDKLNQILLELKAGDGRMYKQVPIRPSDIEEDGMVHIDVSKFDDELKMNLGEIVFCTYPGHFNDGNCKKSKYRIGKLLFQ